MKRLLIPVVLCLTLAAPANAGFNEGVAVFLGGDFESAIREWRPLAEQGDADAQNNLAYMYRNGSGVPKNYGQAVRWYREAADQGLASAQAALGAMHGNGDGVPRDLVKAFFWYSLAAASGDQNASINLDIVQKRLTPAQIAEGRKLVREWRAR